MIIPFEKATLKQIQICAKHCGLDDNPKVIIASFRTEAYDCNHEAVRI